MQVSVEALEGLERQLTISLPAEKIQELVDARLKKLTHTVKINGYRPGKAPLSEITKRYNKDVFYEVTRELLQSSLAEAITEKDLNPAGYPEIENLDVQPGKDMTFSARFEVYPEIEIQELDKTNSVEVIKSEVTEKDVDTMLTNLQGQHKDWKPVERAVKKGDRVTINFEGFLDGEAFEGGSADNFQLEIGSGQMIPGFEDGIVGAKIEKPFEIHPIFPKDYANKELAGKETTFKITVTKVEEGSLPELNDEFATKYGITEGIDALRKDIKENMTRMLERQISTLNREAVFNEFLKKNPVTLPKALIDSEIEELKHEMYHRVFGNKHTENEKIPDFPRELFEEEARKRIHLGLIFSEYTKKHEMSVDSARIDAMIEKLSGAYEDASELRKHYHSNKAQMRQLEALVLEEMVADALLANMEAKEKNMSYEEVVNPKKDQKGE